ncbi:MAG: TIGR03905 family TSCPD domain-containing protein [Lutisporaceae bacterium]
MIYKTKGVCSKEIEFEVKNNIIKKVCFVNGCPGSLQAIGRLVEGLQVEAAIEKLKGIQCGDKGTSCPDQLAKALLSMK